MFLRAKKACPKKLKKILLLNLADFFPLLMPPFILTSLLGLMNGTTENFQNVFNEAQNWGRHVYKICGREKLRFERDWKLEFYVNGQRPERPLTNYSLFYNKNSTRTTLLKLLRFWDTERWAYKNSLGNRMKTREKNVVSFPNTPTEGNSYLCNMKIAMGFCRSVWLV